MYKSPGDPFLNIKSLSIMQIITETLTKNYKKNSTVIKACQTSPLCYYIVRIPRYEIEPVSEYPGLASRGGGVDSHVNNHNVIIVEHILWQIVR